jgi:hypothetical protein
VLTQQERRVIKLLKSWILGLAAIHKSRARQSSRLTWLQKGDANTRYFHLMANAGKKKNFIHSLHADNGMVFTQADKHQVIFNHFLHHIGSYNPRACTLNLDSLGCQPKPLHHLEAHVSEEELKQVIMHSPKEKALGPDGFIGLFFTACWEVIRGDLLHAVDHFFSLN